jgi:hypothetical protein
LSALDGLPVSGSFLGAVQLAPEGLQLVEPAALVVTAPGIIDLADAVSYVYEGSGDDFHFVPLLPGFLGTGAGHTSVLVPIEHFSGGGFTTATLPDMTDLLSELSSTPSAQAEFYRTRIAWWIKEMISNGILDFSDPELSDPYLIHIRGVLNDWFLNFIIPETEASESIEELRRSVQEYIRWKTYIQNLAQEYRIFCIPNPNTGQCPGDSELVRSGADNEMHIAVYDRIDAVLFPLDRECSDITSCQPGYPCPPGATHNMCAGAYYWDMAQPWIYFQVHR